MIYKHHEFVRAKHQFSFFGQEKQRKQIASKRVNEQTLNIHEKHFMESLILAQDERWRHA